jgi:hypothetical protein
MVYGADEFDRLFRGAHRVPQRQFTGKEHVLILASKIRGNLGES